MSLSDEENLEAESHAAMSDSPLSEPYSIFDRQQRALIVLIVSVAATFSGFASNIYFPTLPTIAKDLDVSIELVNLTVTSYLIFQGLAPSLWGPISDVKGRRIAYAGTFVVFIGACIGLALAKSYAALIVLRCLQSTGSASTIAIGSGVIGDITTRANRGGLMGIFQAGLLVPVAVGPVIGGALAGSLGWHSIFWFLTIYGGVFLAAMLLLLPETLRALVGNGSRTPSAWIARYPLGLYQKTSTIQCKGVEARASHPLDVSKKKHVDVLGPLRILVSRQAAPIIFFLAIYYGVWQMSITALSSLLEDKYGFTTTQIGLCFLPNGAGSIVGTLITGRILDLDYRRVKARYAGPETNDTTDIAFPLETARLRLVPAFVLLQIFAILLFGWTIQHPHRISIAAPLVATFITGWTAVATQSVVMTYLADIFADRSAAASASLNLARCLIAAAGTSAVMPLVHAIGVGWAFTVCAGFLVLGVVGLAVQWRYGAVWRAQAAAVAQTGRGS